MTDEQVTERVEEATKPPEPVEMQGVTTPPAPVSVGYRCDACGHAGRVNFVASVFIGKPAPQRIITPGMLPPRGLKAVP